MRVIIAGSRPPKDIREHPARLEQWYEDRYEQLEEVLAKSGMGTLIETVLCGEAQGWDELGKRWAQASGLELDPYPAKWRRADGSTDMGAGMKRNKVMAAAAEGAVIFWNGKSSGARNCIVECEKVGMEPECIWVEVVEP